MKIQFTIRLNNFNVGIIFILVAFFWVEIIFRVFHDKVLFFGGGLEGSGSRGEFTRWLLKPEKFWACDGSWKIRSELPALTVAQILEKFLKVAIFISFQ